MRTFASLLEDKSKSPYSRFAPRPSAAGNVDDRKLWFLDRCKQIHGDRFNYSKFVYVNAKTKGIVICKIHGEFEETPDKHLASKDACVKCWTERRKKICRVSKFPTKPRVTQEEFLKRAHQKYGSKFEYDMTTFMSMGQDKMKITCPIHGAFYSRPSNHISGNHVTGCPLCGKDRKNKSKTRSYDQFVTEVKAIHSNKYIYPESNHDIFVNRRSRVDIYCPKHGMFNMRAQKHLTGQRCWDCAVEEMILDGTLSGGYDERLFIRKPHTKDWPATLYYVELNGGKFYKIGITRVNWSSRWRGLKCNAAGELQSSRIIFQKQTTLYDAFLLERHILKLGRDYRVIRPWSTEIFSVDISNDIKHFFEV